MYKVFILVLFLVTSATHAQAFSLFGSSMEKTVAKDGKVVVDSSGLSAGQSKHYQYTEGKTTIRFFVVRDQQGTVRAALDACEACWREDKGYKLQGGAMLCVNCGMKFALGRIGFVRGGCNPHPIVFTTDGNSLTVTTQELLAGARYFPGNR